MLFPKGAELGAPPPNCNRVRQHQRQWYLTLRSDIVVFLC